MFLHRRKELQVVEYDCTSVRTGRRMKKVGANQKLSVSPIRLSVALARTILSTNPSNTELFLQILSSFFEIQSLIETHNKKLCLTKNTRSKYRDFSLTGRVGELAQAINFLFAQDILKYPLVVDYEGYLINSLNITPVHGSTPDFILSNLKSKNMTLFESKGSHPKGYNDKLKTTLKKGLDQCELAKQFLVNNKIFNVQNTYASGVWFATPNSNWDSHISYSDPTWEQEKIDFDYKSIFRYHYASWFSMIGLFSYSLDLISNRPIDVNVEELQTYNYNGEKFVLFNPNYSELIIDFLYPFIYYIDPFGLIKFGLSERVLKKLVSVDEEELDIRFESVSEENIELFSDGTIIII